MMKETRSLGKKFCESVSSNFHNSRLPNEVCQDSGLVISSSKVAFILLLLKPVFLRLLNLCSRNFLCSMSKFYGKNQLPQQKEYSIHFEGHFVSIHLCRGLMPNL